MGAGVGSASATGTAIGTGASTTAGAGAGAALGTAAMYAWPLAALYGAYRIGSKIHEKSKKGSMTDSDIHMSINPRGAETLHQKYIPGWKSMKKNMPEFLLTKAIWGSSKDDDQIYRDRVRKALKDNQFIDENYNLTLADGTVFDIGKDGSVQNYNVDQTSPETAQLVGAVDPLAHIITAPYGNEKVKSDYTGFFTNAVLSGAPDQQMTNIQGLYQKAGLDRDGARAGVDALFAGEKIDEATRDAYFASIDRVFGVNTQMTPYEGNTGGGGSKPKPKETTAPAPTPAPAPTLASIVPAQPAPPVMPEPDDEKTPQEQQDVDDYVAILNGNISNARELRKNKPRYMYGRKT
jgi:hypothetical protein